MHRKRNEFHMPRGITRRRFLQLTAGGAAIWLVPPRLRATVGYRVGVGRSADPYVAARRAIEASGEWPAAMIAGRTVVIKTNLVSRKPAETGVTTDPQMVRALVDLALGSGAARVVVVEHQGGSPKFTACGYDFFRQYDAAERVTLLDLADEPTELRAVPDGLAYQLIYMPKLVMQDDVIYISAAKLKCHGNALVSLAMKNSFGLPPVTPYQDSWIPGRWAMHKRSVHQTTVDLNLVRPIHFAVVDGIWGMEGQGSPLSGTPVRMDMVIAGRNAVAVDRVCLEAMGVPQRSVQHLEYAASMGLGPADIGEVEVRGDPVLPRPFLLPETSPDIEYPTAAPVVFAPVTGQRATIVYSVGRTCFTRAEIVLVEETRPSVVLVRTLHSWVQHPAGATRVEWDGRDDKGQVVPPGQYTIRVQAADDPHGGGVTFATGRVFVSGARVFLPYLTTMSSQ